MDVMEKVTNLVNAYNAINKFIYYGWNFKIGKHDFPIYGTCYCVPEFIYQAKWTCNEDFMYHKWLTATNGGKDPDCYMTAFWKLLDTRNRMALVDWIMENYNNELGKAK